MKVVAEDLKKSRYSLKITIEPKELIDYFQKKYEKLSLEIKIPGFRPGKAPRKLIEESIGKMKLLSESINQVIQDSYVEAIKEQKLVPVSSPKILISNYPNWGLEESEIKDPLKYEAEFDVMPKVELGDLSKIKIKKREVERIKDSDVEKVLLHLRRQKATFSEVNRGAKKGDRVELSYEGSIKGGKKDVMSAKNHPLILGDNTLIPGFEDQIIGMKKGEKKSFSITFPKNYRAKDLAGQKADFKVELVDLKEIKLPELNDEFAKSFGHRNIDDLRKAVEKSLRAEMEQKIENETENELIEKVLPKLKVEIPSSLIDQEVERIISDLEDQIKSRGLTLDGYLKSIRKSLEDFRKEIKPTAERNLRIGFLLGKIIEQQNIDTKNPKAGKLAIDFLKKKIVN